MTLILASASPRRRELLEQIGIPFEVVVRSIDETPCDDEQATTYVARMAKEKALAVAKEYPQRSILASDTCISFNDTILTKPVDAADAKTMLAMLSGQKHQVLTSVAIVCAQKLQVKTVATDVWFKHLTDKQIANYVATQEPLDKAGSYAIQGFGAILVERISGSYSNVVGLPLTETAEMLEQFNVPIWQK